MQNFPVRRLLHVHPRFRMWPNPMRWKSAISLNARSVSKSGPRGHITRHRITPSAPSAVNSRIAVEYDIETIYGQREPKPQSHGETRKVLMSFTVSVTPYFADHNNRRLIHDERRDSTRHKSMDLLFDLVSSMGSTNVNISDRLGVASTG